ncbi:hypothetical protein BXZ70DRAFT_701288 [Cristinia sonorae]|uniref:Uncharacterized protein n=1 Tax=Cristinia sonorae TaxID=1940300 RepID=A0A8K0UD50_9AGAR|nr:hypothetical protein BXZ70DRAFT_701288 [Cristinia sonorae]
MTHKKTCRVEGCTSTRCVNALCENECCLEHCHELGGCKVHRIKAGSSRKNRRGGRGNDADHDAPHIIPEDIIPAARPPPTPAEIPHVPLVNRNASAPPRTLSSSNSSPAVLLTSNATPSAATSSQRRTEAVRAPVRPSGAAPRYSSQIATPFHDLTLEELTRRREKQAQEERAKVKNRQVREEVVFQTWPLGNQEPRSGPIIHTIQGACGEDHPWLTLTRELLSSSLRLVPPAPNGNNAPMTEKPQVLLS